MKLLLSAVLLFITVTVFGANPSYKDFRGTGGITIVSNPPQGTIVIDGSGISGGVSAATATNISEYFSTNTTGRPAPPFSSVQFNSNGVMQGHQNFTFTNGQIHMSNLVLSTATLISYGIAALDTDFWRQYNIGFDPPIESSRMEANGNLYMVGALEVAGNLNFDAPMSVDPNMVYIRSDLNPEESALHLVTVGNNLQTGNFVTMYGYEAHQLRSQGPVLAGLTAPGGFFGTHTIGVAKPGPRMLTVRGTNDGGTLPSEGATYIVTALNALGQQSSASSIAYTGVVGNARMITWNAVSGASTYRVYGRFAGAYGRTNYWTVSAPTTNYLDTGASGTYGVFASPNWFISKMTSNAVVFSSPAGAEQFVFTNGLAGFGINAPTERLDVAGVGFFHGANASAPNINGVFIGTNSGKGGTITSANLAVAYLNLRLEADDIVFGAGPTAAQERMRIDGDTGNVGIGTAVPSSTLDVTGRISAVSAIITNNIALWPDSAVFPVARSYLGHFNGTSSGGIPALGTNFGFWSLASTRLSLWRSGPQNLENWTVTGSFTVSNQLAVPNMPGSGSVVAIDAGGTTFRTNITGLPAGNNFEVQFNNAGVMGASPNLRFLGAGYQLQIVNPTASGEVDINGEGFISQATGGSAALAFGIGAQTNLMINPGGAVIVRPSPGIGTNSFQVEGTNKVPIVSVSSNGNFLVKSGLAIGPSPATITNTLFGSAALDFPSTVAGSSSDLPITVTGCTSNNCHVSLCVPWQAASGGGIFTHFESNDVVYIRFSNNQLTLAIDPTPATFSALVFRVQ